MEAECDEREAKEEKDIQNSPERESDRLWEKKDQIFCPAFNHLRSVPIHPGGEGLGCVAEPDDSGTAFDVVSKRDVLENVLADCTVASDRKVGVTFYQDELAVGGG